MRDVWSAAISAPAERYELMCAEFRWQIPESFNFATDIVDRWASERDGPALLWENANGERCALDYSELSRLSCQLANVLRDRGVEKGDRVIIMLPRVGEMVEVAMIDRDSVLGERAGLLHTNAGNAPAAT
jgi:non-ribosomal peptide synthetase component E (peptide arylation enzyme)